MDPAALFEHCLDIEGDVAAWSKRLPGGGGVYALLDDQDRLVLLSGAESLRRAVTFRLNPPPDASRKRADLRAVVRRIRWQRTYSAFETAFEFHRLSRLLVPDRYMEMCAFGPCWFVHAKPADRLPRLIVAKSLKTDGGVQLGPFPTKAAADRFVAILEDLFDLCRCFNVLERAPRGEPCVYHQMGRCAAPCAGYSSLETYRALFAGAVEFGAGAWQEETGRWAHQMRRHAARQQYEEANRIKQRIQRADELRGENYRFVRPLDQFNYLVIQRGEGTSHLRPFFVRRGWIERGASTRRNELPVTAQTWVRLMQSAPQPPHDPDEELRTEWIWLVSHYLFQGDRAPGLFLGPDRWPVMDSWIGSVEERVLRTRSQSRMDWAPVEGSSPLHPPQHPPGAPPAQEAS